MSLREKVGALAEAHPEFIPDLASVMGSSCCRKASDTELRRNLIRLAYEKPEIRPMLLPMLGRIRPAE